MRQIKYTHEAGVSDGKRLEMDIDYMWVQKEWCSPSKSDWPVLDMEVLWRLTQKLLYFSLLSIFHRLSVQNRINVEYFVVSRYSWNVSLSFSTSFCLSHRTIHALFSVNWLMVSKTGLEGRVLKLSWNMGWKLSKQWIHIAQILI